MNNRKTHVIEPRRRPGLGLSNFREMIERIEADRPDIPVYSYMDYASGECTYVMPKELRMRVEGLGTWLYESGKHKKVVGILGSNSYEWLLAFYGAQYCAAVVLLLDKTAGEDILKDQIVRSGCKDIIYSADLAEKAQALASDLGLSLIPFGCLEENAAKGCEMIEQGKTACLDNSLNGDDMAVIMYTSGTTGISKGVMLSSRNLLTNCDCVEDIIEVRKDQVHLLPLNHIYALLAQFLAVTSGKRLHICLNMRHMFEDFQTAKPELLFVVPLIAKNLYGVIWQTIRKQGDEEKVKKMIAENNEKGNVSYEERRKMFAPYLAVLGGRLEKMISGGAPIEVQLIRGFEDLGLPICEGYGITECSPVLAVNPEERYKVGTVGIATPGHELLIENPNEEGIGEICAKGPSVMLGYYNMEKETEEALAGGWFHTGDLGFIDEDNYLTITGRIKNLIILSNGENISPEELESKLYSYKAISEAVVYEKEDKIAAMIYPDNDYLEANGIKDGEAHIKECIDEYNRTASAVKKINFVYFRNEPFEKTATQKIKRNFEKM